MKKLWAPWREKYIKRGNKQKENDRFLFTRLYRDKKKDKSNFIFARSQHAFAVLNIFPYNNGHVLIVPNRNVKDLDELEEKEREDLFYLLGDVKACLQETLKPQGFNIGINIGKAAGAGIPEHLHIHVVPRWLGDSNFMPVIGGTKVISQSLNRLYILLKDAYEKRIRRARK